MGIRYSRRAGWVGIAVAGLLAAGLVTAGMLGAPWARAADPPRYVAMGDSSASGPGVPDQVGGACGRSNRNWPSYLGRILGVTPTDVTCSGATLASSVSQLDALHGDADLVTIAIGANDIEMWQAFACAQPADAAACRQYLAGQGVDYDARISQLGQAFRDRLSAIRANSAPDVRIFVVGYLTYWSPGGCPDRDPYSPSVADYIQGVSDKLMANIRTWAEQSNATYVDIRTPSGPEGPTGDHSLCEDPGQRWLEGNSPDPKNPAEKYHPNALGMCHAAMIIGEAIKGPPVDDPGCPVVTG